VVKSLSLQLCSASPLSRAFILVRAVAAAGERMVHVLVLGARECAGFGGLRGLVAAARVLVLGLGAFAGAHRLSGGLISHDTVQATPPV